MVMSSRFVKLYQKFKLFDDFILKGERELTMMGGRLRSHLVPSGPVGTNRYIVNY